MYLDETILQSRTTISLVDFIKRLYKEITPNDLSKATSLKNDYEQIIVLYEKAVKKRSFK